VTKKRRETLIALCVGIPMALAIAAFVPGLGWPRYRAARAIDLLVSCGDDELQASRGEKELAAVAASHPEQLVRYLDDDRRYGRKWTVSCVVALALLDVGDDDLTRDDVLRVDMDFIAGTAAITSYADSHERFLRFCGRWHAYADGDGPRPGVH
jgi:hypothetical protein